MTEKDGLPHQPAGWFAMTEFEVRRLSGGGEIAEAPPVADEVRRFRGSAPAGGRDSAREPVGTTVGKTRAPPYRSIARLRNGRTGSSAPTKQDKDFRTKRDDVDIVPYGCNAYPNGGPSRTPAPTKRLPIGAREDGGPYEAPADRCP